MKTKYVLAEDGTYLIFHEYLAEHVRMAALAGYFPSDLASAGFVWLDEEGAFHTYGESISTGKQARKEDGAILTDSFTNGYMAIVHDMKGLFATNDPDRFEQFGSWRATLEEGYSNIGGTRGLYDRGNTHLPIFKKD